MTVEDALRLVSAAQLLLLAMLVLRDYRRTRAGPATALFAVCIACYLVLPLLMHHGAPRALEQAAFIGALAVPIAFWFATRLHFDDAFEPTALHAAAFLALLAARYIAVEVRRSGGAPADYGPTPWNLASTGLALLAIGDALRRIHKGARSDLLLARLRLRYVVLMTSGAYAVVVLIAEALVRPGSAADRPLSFLNAVGLLLVVFAVSALVLRLEPNFLKATASREAAPPPNGLREKLDRLIEDGEIFRTEGLTIGALADRLGDQEYKVRHLVNSHLGFKNFNAFLNHYRVREARKLLEDAAHGNLGVAEIAYRLGYSSLGPFNRAFKALVGQTPTEFRKRLKTRNSAPNPESASRLRR